MKVSDLTRLIADTFNYKVKFIPVPLKLLLVVADLSEFYASNISHREPKLTRYALQSLGVTQTLSIEKAQKLLGYRPTISLKESFENLI